MIMYIVVGNMHYGIGISTSVQSCEHVRAACYRHAYVITCVYVHHTHTAVSPSQVGVEFNDKSSAVWRQDLIKHTQCSCHGTHCNIMLQTCMYIERCPSKNVVVGVFLSSLLLLGCYSHNMSRTINVYILMV